MYRTSQFQSNDNERQVTGGDTMRWLVKRGTALTGEEKFVYPYVVELSSNFIYFTLSNAIQTNADFIVVSGS